MNTLDKSKYSLIHPDELEIYPLNSYKDYINGYYKYKIPDLKREECNNFIILENGNVIFTDKKSYKYDIKNKKCVLSTRLTVTICPDNIKLKDCKISNPFNNNELLH